jgi:hypothetical protein
MSERPDYLTSVREVLQSVDCDLWPSELVGRWLQLVEDAEDGYRWDVSEYDNEIRARSCLDALLTSPELSRFPELEILAAEVRPIDDRFRALLLAGVERPGKSTWFERGVLSRAGEAYANFFRSAYGIDVEVDE